MSIGVVLILSRLVYWSGWSVSSWLFVFAGNKGEKISNKHCLTGPDELSKTTAAAAGVLPPGECDSAPPTKVTLVLQTHTQTFN